MVLEFEIKIFRAERLLEPVNGIARLGEVVFHDRLGNFAGETARQRNQTLAVRGEFDYGKGIGKDAYPVFKNFYAGGIGSVRGGAYSDEASLWGYEGFHAGASVALEGGAIVTPWFSVGARLGMLRTDAGHSTADERAFPVAFAGSSVHDYKPSICICVHI